MSERNGQNASRDLRESVCINVDRVYDCCKDRDCITDARVYVSAASQEILDRAVDVKAVSAEVLWTYIDVEALPFNRGFYTIDIRVFFRVTVDVFVGMGRPQRIYGLATYDKRVILYGSEGKVKTYSSVYVPHGEDTQLINRSNAPKATVELVEPVALSARIIEPCQRCGCCDIDLSTIPECICRCFDDNLCDCSSGNKLYITLGLFSIVRLMREVQILVPSYDFCIPEKECKGPSEEDPCSLFYKMDFPVNEFFPPRLSDVSDEPECGQKPVNKTCGCCK